MLERQQVFHCRYFQGQSLQPNVAKVAPGVLEGVGVGQLHFGGPVDEHLGQAKESLRDMPPSRRQFQGPGFAAQCG